MSNFFHPGLLLIACGIAAALLPTVARRLIAIAGPAIALISIAFLPIGTVREISFGDRLTLEILQVNNYNYIFLIIIALIALITGIYAAHRGGRLESFCALNYTGATLCVALAGDWMTLLIFWEYMAVTSLGLVWCGGHAQATKAGFRYLLMHMLGGNLLLFGILLKLFQGSSQITCLTGQHDLAFWLIFLGVAINAAVVPLHTWVPDAYPEASHSGTLYMASFTTKVAILSMLRIFEGESFLIVLGVIMMLYGAIYALMENNLRRVLSYHIISQLGFMVIDIGIGGELGANAASALAVGNILYKALLFMCAGAIIHATGITKIHQLGGLAKKMPLVCICFFVGALSIAGIPPFAGFTCKSLSMMAAQSTGSALLEILLLLGSIGTALSILFKMGYFTFFGTDRDIRVAPVPKNMLVAIVITTVLCVVVGIAPQPFYQLLPFPAHYHIYSLHHVLEYTQLIPAALLVFVLFLKHMAPHDTISLDFDWFWRNWMKKGFFGFSALFGRLQDWSDSLGPKRLHKIGQLAANPMRRTPMHPHPGTNPEGVDKPSRFQEDAYRPRIGSGMLAIFITILVVAGVLLLQQFFIY